MNKSIEVSGLPSMMVLGSVFNIFRYEVSCISKIMFLRKEVHYNSNKVIDHQCLWLELRMNPKSQVAATWTNMVPEKLHQLCTLEQRTHSKLRLLQRYWELYWIFPWEPNSKAINQSIYLSTQQNTQDTMTIICLI